MRSKLQIFVEQNSLTFDKIGISLILNSDILQDETLSTVKHLITRFEKRNIQINRQRSVFKKLLKAFCQVNSACINSPGLIYCHLI